MNRESMVISAGRVVFKSASAYSANDTSVSIKLPLQTFSVGAQGFSHAQQRLQDLVGNVGFTPDGRWSAALIAALWPYGGSAANSLVFTNTDYPLAIHGQNSHLYTAISAAVTKMPEIMFSAVKSLVGSVEFSFIRGNGMDWDDANSLFTHATTGGTFADSTYSASAIKTQPYVGAWAGKTGMTSLVETVDGFLFRPSVTLQPLVTDSSRTVNYIIKDVSAELVFRPIEPTAAQFLALLEHQGTGVLPGKPIGSVVAGADFTVVGADGITYLTMNNVSIREGGFMFGGEFVNDAITLISQPEFSSGVQQALWTLAAS